MNTPTIIKILNYLEIPASEKNICTVFSMINGTSFFYRSFEIPKRNGGTRTIQSPYATLRYIQRLIYEKYLFNARVYGNSFAFTKKRSVVNHAKIHLNSNELLTVDIQNFFSSISKQQVFEAFQSLSIDSESCAYLSNLCTLEGSLPQGASTSPMLSNIVFFRVDIRLHCLAHKLNLRYSRYADDLAFSGDFIPKNLHKIIDKIISSYGFNLNSSKTKYKLTGSKKIITGVSISSGKLKVPKSYKRILKAQVYELIKYKDDLSKMFNFEPMIYEKTLGKLNYMLHVEPDNSWALDKKNELINNYKEFRELSKTMN